MIKYNKINIDDIIKYLPLKQVKTKIDGYIALCPFHKDSNPSLHIRKDEAVICFSCNYTNNIRGLTKDLLGITVNKLLGIKEENFRNQYFLNKFQTINKIKRIPIKEEIKIKGKFKSIYENGMIYDYIKKRKLSEVFIKDFDIKYADYMYINTTLFKNRLIIPIVENKEIISYEGRDVTGKQKAKVLYPKNCKMKSLFNIDNLNRKKPLFLVEGLMDLAPIYTNFSKNVTTPFGISVTNNQMKLLNEFQELIVIPDNDDRGLDFLSFLDANYQKEFYICFLKSKDPNDASIEELQYSIKNKISSTEYFLNKYDLLNKKKKYSIF